LPFYRAATPGMEQPEPLAETRRDLARVQRGDPCRRQL